MIYHIIEADGEQVGAFSLHPEDLDANLSGGRVLAPAPFPAYKAYWSWGTSAWVEIPAAGSIFEQWNPTTKAWVDPRDLAQLKSYKWFEMKQARAAAAAAAVVWDSSAFDADPDSRNAIAQAATAAIVADANSVSFSVAWTLADNSVRTLSSAQIQSLALAMAQSANTVQVIGQGLRSEIVAVTVSSALPPIVWPE